MYAINEPIGRYVALANLEEDVFTPKRIKQDVANLVDLIIARIHDKPIDEVANSLLESIFELRLDLVEWLASNDKDPSIYLEMLNKHISANLQLAPNSALAEAVSSVLLSYEKMVSPTLETLPGFREQLFEVAHNARPEYATFKLVSHHPSPQIRHLKHWLDSSLQLEAGIILADLILTNQVQIPQERVQAELTDFLYSTITRFGGYSIFTGFWTPAQGDTSDQTNRMKIFSATLELDSKKFLLTSKEGLSKIIHN
jgi:hypothetical protein